MRAASVPKKWHEFWQQATRPPASIKDEERRQQAGLLTALLVALLLASLIVAPLWVLASPEFVAAPYISAVLVITLGVAYIASRTRHFRVGALILVGLLPLTVLLVMATAQSPMAERMVSLNFLVTTVLLANIFLGIRATIVVGVLSFVATGAFLFVPDVRISTTYGYLVFMGVMSALIVVTAVIRNNYAERLRESELRYRSLFEQSNDAVFILDLNGVHLKANQRAADMLGYTPEEIAGLSVWDVVAHSEHAKSRNILGRMRAGEHIPPYERIFRRKDGTEFPAEVNVELVRDASGQPVHIQSILRDISERKRAEQALREREEYLRAVIDNTPSGMHFYQLAPDGRLLLENANPAASNIVDIDYQQCIGKPIEEAFPGLLGTDIPTHFKRIAEHGDSHHEKELTYHDKSIDGAFEIQAFQTMPDRMAVSFIDITERKQAQEQALALAVEKERIKSLNQFVQNASHELRTPLSIINTGIYLMGKTTVDEDRQHHAAGVRHQVTRLTQLLDVIFRTVMLDSGVQFAVQMADINVLLRQVIDRSQPAWTAKGLAVQFDPQTSRMFACVDVHWLAQAIENVFENAIRFTPDQGSVTARTYEQNGSIIIEVCDTGVGIHPEALPHIFERFWRQDEAHSTPGFGLGLSIAQKVVEQHGGRIEVESEEGRGSTFRIILPKDAENCPEGADVSAK